MTKEKTVKVMITTDNTKRGVFTGIIKETDYEKLKGEKEVDVFAEDIRMVVYWSSDVKGIIGLASTGPSKSCRVTAPVKKGLIKGVSAVFELTNEAYKKFESEPWG